MAKSPEELAHIEWLGYVQPVGLVVSIPAMLEAQCYVNKNIMAEHAKFLNCLVRDSAGNLQSEIRDLREFVQAVLGWESNDLITLPAKGPLPPEHSSLEVILPQYNETLRPTHIVPEFSSNTTHQPLPSNHYPLPTNHYSLTPNHYLLLIQELASKTDFDEPLESDSAKHWNAPPQAKFERLLRETGVPIGLLFNRSQFRLVYAPRGETSGYATFNVDEMAQVAGRPMFAALHMLLGVERLFSLADKQRLPYILENSRKYQNTVSTALAEQVTSALFELLRGFQAANDQRVGELLRHVLANNPQHVYHGLLTVLMRLVFVLYAEDRGLVSSDPTYTNHYSVSGLFERLRSEAGRFPDTMDQRFGAWAQLLTLFRLVYEGGQHAELKIPARKGYLFDPNRYPFLEGRFDDGKAEVSSVEEQSSPIRIPHISDGVIYRVLEDLLILDGERLSYRTLDVEQIGSVYEAIMGFELQVSAGKSIAIKPVKSHGAPATIDLEALLAAKPNDRAKLLNEWTDQKLGASDATALKDATSIDELVAALDKKIAKHVTPGIVPADSMVFQPSNERRRSGSHYTPRSLTQPIVRTTLEPILKQLCDPEAELPRLYEPSKEDKQRYTKGEIEARIRQSEKRIEYAKAARAKGVPHPNQILDLKVCDPAMGSGAFLVETCRQLADHLVESWHAHATVNDSSTNDQPLPSNHYSLTINHFPPDIPPDEDEVLYARRTVAQRCLYGVDKNVMAVDLAKLSLWLVTLAKDHPFTFLDHSLRHGDSLVGLTREQIIGFHWEPKKQKKFGEDLIQRRLDRATEARAKILSAREDVAYRDQEQRMAVANEALNLIRLVGDACVSCFFAADKSKAREDELERVFGLASSYLSSLASSNQSLTTIPDFQSRAALQTASERLKAGPHPVPCFHWEIEFPEVFSRENGGFDAFVGNPPFLGGMRISNAASPAYKDFLYDAYQECRNRADLVAYFFRLAFRNVRQDGAFGLIATNTIAQGDTRDGGLGYICRNGGRIFSAEKRMAWPGVAAVVVSVIHVRKGPTVAFQLNGRPVSRITSFLFTSGSDTSPFTLKANANLSYKGSVVLGMGFTFDDDGNQDVATSTERLRCLIERDPSNKHLIFPYIGGEEVVNNTTDYYRRYIIDFGDRTLEESRKWPDLLQIVEEKVKPFRDTQKRNVYREKWWQYAEKQLALYARAREMRRVLVIPEVCPHLTVAFLPTDVVFASTLYVVLLDTDSAFCILQSRIHECWTRFLSSSMKDDLRYVPGDCLETFPLPGNRDSKALEETGKKYFMCRSQLVKESGLGLTKTYNRFHSPDDREPKILELRRLHSEIDVAVLQAYGWDDLADQAAQPDFCQFLLDYEEDEDDTTSDSSSTRQKKKPWRYRWPDDFRDEVLARLLELNEQRHKEELLLVKGKETDAKPAREPSKKPAKAMPLLDGLDQVEVDRDERLILLIVDSFKLITRTALDEAFIAMKYPKLRKSRLGLGDPPKSVPRTDAGRDAIIGGLVDRDFLEKYPSDHQQVWKLGANAPSLAATKTERQALDETKAIFQKSIDANDDLASCKEGVTDAKPGLVSIA
ncbi:MAG: hypothetical protein JNK90_23545 [Planctomycetaceae bacterium]|nr:hypothetical protein [Planctomycetaceae bacterium]